MVSKILTTKCSYYIYVITLSEHAALTFSYIGLIVYCMVFSHILLHNYILHRCLYFTCMLNHIICTLGETGAAGARHKN